ncbi:phosphotransferase family protein [Actinomadura hibisca]|uniref:phosphotransferase family protein n=1 Tax=Actinomadura hibisca TaxID=68565 RepID=UPI00082AADAF|nr:phosphotransferase [Actinomadura hibisca]
MPALRWDAVPESHRAAIEVRCGQIVKAEPITGGLMPGLTARLHTADCLLFFKAIPADHPAVRLYRRERTANQTLSETTPAPRLLWSIESEGWVSLLLEHLDGRDADLSPGSPDLPGVLAALRRLNSLRTGEKSMPPVADNLAALQDKAAALADKQLPGAHWAMYAEAVAGFVPETAAGPFLVHYDPHPGNFQVTTGGVKVVDWAFACAGASWIDAAFLVPRLIEAGHTPAQAEALVNTHPGWTTAPADAVTGLAALWSLFREYKALYGPDEARGFRAQAAEAGRAWVNYRTR